MSNTVYFLFLGTYISTSPACVWEFSLMKL